MFNDLRKNNKYLNDVKHFEKLVSPIYEDLYRYIYCIVSNKVLAEDALRTCIYVKRYGMGVISDFKD